VGAFDVVKLRLTTDERQGQVMSRRANVRGVPFIDVDLLDKLQAIATPALATLEHELTQLTKGRIKTIDSIPARLKKWLKEEHNIIIKSMKEQDIEQLLVEGSLPAFANEILKIRLAGRAGAHKRLGTIRDHCSPDRRVRDMFQTYGASHTGRYASNKDANSVQGQNFPKSDFKSDEEFATGLAAVKTGNFELLSKLYPRPLELINNLMRSTICAPEGKLLMGADFSGIEYIGACYLADQTSVIEEYREFFQNKDSTREPYILRACDYFGLPHGSVTKKTHPVQRGEAKVGTLAFLYRGCIGAWRRMAKEPPATEYSNRQIKEINQLFKQVHPEIYKLWGQLETAARSAIRHPEQVFPVGKYLAYVADADGLYLLLPSGRPIRYPNARIADSVRWEGQNAIWCSRQEGEVELYSHLMNNAVQGFCRDILINGLLQVDREFSIIGHIHDESLVEVKENAANLERFVELLTTPPTWAPDLPLGAEGWMAKRFDKAQPMPAGWTPNLPAPTIAADTTLPLRDQKVILLDPPWRWMAHSKKGMSRSADARYKTMKMPDLIAMGPDIRAMAAKDCFLIMWAINSMIPQALELINAWGFEYKTVLFTWAKQNPSGEGWHQGMGFHTRQNTELCFVATRGHPQRWDWISHDPEVKSTARSVSELLVAARRMHSQKPDEIHGLIEQLYPGPYTECFARQNFPGWNVAFSNQVSDHGPVDTRRESTAFDEVEEDIEYYDDPTKAPVEPTVAEASASGAETSSPEPEPTASEGSMEKPAATTAAEPRPGPQSKPRPQPEQIIASHWAGSWTDDLDSLKARISLADYVGETQARCPFHADRTPSLSIYANGFYCHACHARGDHLDWLMGEAKNDAGDIVQRRDGKARTAEEAMDKLRAWRGRTYSAATAAAQDSKRAQENLAEAQALWDEAGVLIGGPGEAYFADTRLIHVGRLWAEHNGVLRYHPAPFPNEKDVARFPGILGRFEDCFSDAFAGLQRIALQRTADGKIAKVTRKMLGSWPRARAIKLWPLSGDVLYIAEGIETALAAATRKKFRGQLIKPVWALGSKGAIARFPVIPGVRRLVILVDHDEGDAGHDAAIECARYWQLTGVEVELFTPFTTGHDINDLVRGYAHAATV
jgi:N6-adenosine-specific RNA methylase IME4